MTLKIQALCLDPLDALFFRDGRPFGEASTGRSGLPQPQTLAGALRTALLDPIVDWNRLAQAVKRGLSFADALKDGQPSEAAAVGALRFRGPWFMKDDEVLWPTPASLHRVKSGVKGTSEGELCRLDPLDDEAYFPGFAPRWEGERPLLPKSRQNTEPLGGYLTSAGMKSFLDGQVPRQSEHIAATDLFENELRTGIGVDPDRLSVTEGLIYGVEKIVLKKGVRFYAEILSPESAFKIPSTFSFKFGGEGHRVLARVQPPVSRPCGMGGGAGSTYVLVQPALLNGALPRGLPLVAAAVHGSEAVSGWDMALSGPKPTRFAVKAGATYFALNGAAPQGLGRPEDLELGYGDFLTGAWQYV